jgi:hypothetical protein
MKGFISKVKEHLKSLSGTCLILAFYRTTKEDNCNVFSIIRARIISFEAGQPVCLARLVANLAERLLN